MKNLNRLFNLSFFFVSLAVMFVSCVKKDDFYKKDTTEANRKEVVQFAGELADGTGLVQIARTANGGMDTFALIDIRRYPNNETGLNEPLTIKLQADSTLIDAYDTANGTAYVQLPSSAYTLSSDFTTITFGPGEGDKIIKIFLNQALLDFSLQYALAFTITDGGGATINPDLQTIYYNIGVKNQYDGHYQVTGTMVDILNSTLTGAYPMDVFLITAGANSVYLYDNAIGGVYHSILSSGSLSYYGAFGVQINFDPSGNGKVISVQSPYAPASNTRDAALDPSGTNQWDPSTKGMAIKYFMLQPSLVPTPPNIRTTFDENFQYLGPR